MTIEKQKRKGGGIVKRRTDPQSIAESILQANRKHARHFQFAKCTAVGAQGGKTLFGGTSERRTGFVFMDANALVWFRDQAAWFDYLFILRLKAASSAKTKEMFHEMLSRAAEAGGRGDSYRLLINWWEPDSLIEKASR